MTRRDPVPELSRLERQPYRSPEIRDYGRVRDLTRNAPQAGSTDFGAFDTAS